MSVTRLKRKHRKNIARANNKQRIIKNLLRTPVLKNVDLDELKSRFATPEAAAPAAEAPKAAKEDKAAPAAESDKSESLVDKAKHAVSDVVDAVSHSAVVEKAKEVVDNVVDTVKHAVGADAPAAEAPAADKTAENAADFDSADAVTKPVNADGQEGTHPKPEISL
ncbi:hypothetical protein [Hymenobacter coccineus]|uniref:Uncharacterized protein n=1 Tax=Hymenobacter coccineus TaxID=1908235 RepID=A0A1G1STU8_9BACT|nr:hypothetical protein [Hymenobacter coccineus]OGX82060.1 hypothetical protein BEN49_14615 [Hymenobacter coccineus]